MDKNIKIVSGYMGSPLENFGLANFIQAYIKNEPYFRYNNKPHHILLEELLKEFDLDFERCNKYDINQGKPKPKGENYSLVGEGQINEGYLIDKENVSELGEQRYYVVFPCESDYYLYPSLKHFNEILNNFDLPIIFGSQEYQTEEQKGFLNYDPIEEELRSYRDLGECEDLEEYF